LPEKTIIQRYRNGESIKSLASEYRVSPNTIKKRLILRNVAVRTWKA
jgi:Mor family transcriptional regulator